MATNTYVNTRQILNSAALSTSIGSSAGATVDVILGLIDSKMVTLTGTQTLSNKSFLSSFNIDGSSSGIVTVGVQATAGTYNFNLPTTPGTAGQVLASGGGSGAAMTWVTGATNAAQRNYLLNSAIDIHQGGQLTSVTSAANPTSTDTFGYVVEQWWIDNILGAGTTQAVMTASLTAGAVPGSINGLQVKITTAPSGSNLQNTGFRFGQVLSANDAAAFYGGTASIALWAKGLGVVNTVSIGLYSMATEAKPGLAAGTATLISTSSFTVNTSTFTQLVVPPISVGTGFTPGVGTLAVVVGIGTSHAVNDGVVIEQAQMNLGGALAPYQRNGSTYADELNNCKKFYQVTAFASGLPGMTGQCTSGSAFDLVFRFLPQMRQAPISSSTGASAVTSANGSVVAVNTLTFTSSTSEYAFIQGTTTGAPLLAGNATLFFGDSATVTFYFNAQI